MAVEHSNGEVSKKTGTYIRPSLFPKSNIESSDATDREPDGSDAAYRLNIASPERRIKDRAFAETRKLKRIR